MKYAQPARAQYVPHSHVTSHCQPSSIVSRVGCDTIDINLPGWLGFHLSFDQTDLTSHAHPRSFYSLGHNKIVSNKLRIKSIPLTATRGIPLSP
ncbi:Protein ALEX [Dirofilaria immitis]